ncbi:MAG: hypothetical protein PSY12_09060 [bacterium]|nr:hypothetical protein [bacterium]
MIRTLAIPGRLLMPALLLMPGCGSQSGDGVGGVSASEASALNDAAAMLDAHAGAAQTTDRGLNPAASAAARADRGRIAPSPAQPANTAP